MQNENQFPKSPSKSRSTYWAAAISIPSLLLIGAAIFKPIPVNFGSRNIFVAGSETEFVERIKQIKTKPIPFQIEKRTLTSSDGAKLGAIYLKHEKPRGLLVYFQGGGSASWAVLDSIINNFQDLELDILIHDYRGSGLSIAPADISKLVSDANQWIDDAKRPLQSKLPIIYYGVSMGSLFSAEIAQTNIVNGLILDSAITNVEELVMGQVPWYARPFVRIKVDSGLAVFNNLKPNKSLSVPSLFLVGEKDKLTPPSFSHSIASQPHFGTCSTVKIIQNIGHAAALDDPIARQHITMFIRDILAGKNCKVTKP